MVEITHPKKFEINGVFYQVTALTELTDDQALKIVLIGLRDRKPKKSDLGKVVKVLSYHTQSSLEVL